MAESRGSTHHLYLGDNVSTEPSGLTPESLPTRAMMDLLANSAERVKSLQDLQLYAQFASVCTQVTGQALGWAVREALFDGAGLGKTPTEMVHVESLLDQDSTSPNHQHPAEVSMLISSTLGQLREVSRQLLVVQALVDRYAAENAPAEGADA